MRSVLSIQFSTLWRSQKNHILDQVYLELARLKYSRQHVMHSELR